jgi:hypothetical protein
MQLYFNFSLLWIRACVPQPANLRLLAHYEMFAHAFRVLYYYSYCMQVFVLLNRLVTAVEPGRFSAIIQAYIVEFHY